MNCFYLYDTGLSLISTAQFNNQFINGVHVD
jgi:hypothetical protein